MLYVDYLKNYGWVMYGRKIKSCHLFGTNKEELISFAIEIGLKTEYLQKNNAGIYHFDLTPGKRHVAIVHGAHVVDNKEYRQIRKTLAKEKGCHTKT